MARPVPDCLNIWPKLSGRTTRHKPVYLTALKKMRLGVSPFLPHLRVTQWQPKRQEQTKKRILT